MWQSGSGTSIEGSSTGAAEGSTVGRVPGGKARGDCFTSRTKDPAQVCHRLCRRFGLAESLRPLSRPRFASVGLREVRRPAWPFATDRYGFRAIVFTTA